MKLGEGVSYLDIIEPNNYIKITIFYFFIYTICDIIDL